VKLRFGRKLVSAIDIELRKADLSAFARLGLLRMAGLIADPALEEAVEVSWGADNEKSAHLDDYLITASYCYGDQPERLLGPICDAWQPCRHDQNRKIGRRRATTSPLTTFVLHFEGVPRLRRSDTSSSERETKTCGGRSLFCFLKWMIPVLWNSRRASLQL
jgi:hypothetical protein